VADGRWLVADVQTAGRGRQGRSWVSPAGNLYASGLVRLRADDPPAPTLALVAGLALHQVLADGWGRPETKFELKWPNDMMVNGAKIAGILLEREADAVVIGVGVNLAHHPQGLDRAVTSLAAIGAVVPTPAQVVEALASALAEWLGLWRAGAMAGIIAAWIERAHPIGTLLAVNTGQHPPLNGAFAGLNAEGALKLRLADGRISVIHAGDVFLV